MHSKGSRHENKYPQKLRFNPSKSTSSIFPPIFEFVQKINSWTHQTFGAHWSTVSGFQGTFTYSTSADALAVTNELNGKREKSEEAGFMSIRVECASSPPLDKMTYRVDLAAA
jgi:hypothetical protein